MISYNTAKDYHTQYLDLCSRKTYFSNQKKSYNFSLVKDFYLDNLSLYIYDKSFNTSLLVVPTIIENIVLKNQPGNLDIKAFKIFISNIVDNKPIYLMVIIVGERDLMEKFVYTITEFI